MNIRAWHLLAEIMLRGGLNGTQEEQESIGSVISAARSLNIPQEVMRRISHSITAALLNAELKLEPYGADTSVSICIYSPVPRIVGVPSGDLQVSTESDIPVGWGFFLIERLIGHPATGIPEALYSIELFLYAAQ